MKKNLPLFTVLIFILTLVFSCNTEDAAGPDNNSDDEDGIISPSNADELSEILVFRNSEVINESALPQSSSPSEAPVVSHFDKSVSYNAGSKIYIPVDVAALSEIDGVYIQVEGASQYFDVPINTTTSNGTVSVPFTLPSEVEEGTFVLILKFYDSDKNISLSTEVIITVTKPSKCGVTKVSGGEGLTSNLFEVPNTVGQIKISYDTYNVKDKIDVFQNGTWIGGTGQITERNTLRKAADCIVATESKGYVGKESEFLFNYNPDYGTNIEVVVSGCEDGGTKWEYTFSCPTENEENELPAVNTLEVSSIENNTVVAVGDLISDNGSAITARGFVWSTSPNPTIALSTKIIDGSAAGDGIFVLGINGLSANTTYYLRAFATNSAGTAYGTEVTFTTTGGDNTPSFELDGTWLHSSGTGLIISGTTGVFYSFNSNWQDAADHGIVSLGDTKIKDISKVSDNKWTCLELWTRRTNGVPVETVWSYEGDITMSEDGNSITIGSNVMIDGISNGGSQVFVRQ
ncbi:MAG TPA: hypothetical protein VD908_17150 [Cytophagales bacterium]|nr:hypothetical protein [Cytophagales bacterium]